MTGVQTCALPISIGHTTSETTINDNLRIKGFVSASGTIIAKLRELRPPQTTGAAAPDGNANGDVWYNGNTGTTAGKVYYYSGADAWTLADADASTATYTGMLAVALGSNSGTNGMLLRGFIISDQNLTTAGAKLYLSATAGAVTQTQPGSGDATRIVGYVTDATNDIMYFNPDNTYVLRA